MVGGRLLFFVEEQNPLPYIPNYGKVLIDGSVRWMGGECFRNGEYPVFVFELFVSKFSLSLTVTHSQSLTHSHSQSLTFDLRAMKVGRKGG